MRGRREIKERGDKIDLIKRDKRVAETQRKEETNDWTSTVFIFRALNQL